MVSQTCQSEFWATVDFFPKKTVDYLVSKFACRALRGQTHQRGRGGLGGRAPPEFFSILQGNGANLDHPRTFKDYSKQIKKMHFFNKN